MSREREVVRQSFAVRADTPRRRPDERLALRFPSAVAFLGRLVQRRPPHSRLRRALIRWAAEQGFRASNRGDPEAAFLLWHPECVSIFPPQLLTLGTEGGTRGREERIAFEHRWRAEWGWMRYEPNELVDLGDNRILFLGHIRGGGLHSGVPIDTEWGLLVTLSDGRVIREQVFFDRTAALEAAGLSE